jgi:predicted DNA-binding transcriptional regulator YafY
MKYLTKKETNIILKNLSNTSNKNVKNIIKKLKSPGKKRVYVHEKSEVRKLLEKTFKEKRRVKIRYYSPHSDEHTTRVVEIYQFQGDVITTFCHLRKDERNFVIDRITSAAILDEKYTIPKGWSPESIILDK